MLRKYMNLDGHIRTTNCSPVAGQIMVQQGIACTPAQIDILTRQGKPVGSGILPDDMFDDGQPMCKTEVPIDFQRGIDVVDMWNLEKSAIKKIDSFKNKSINTQPKNE